MRKNRRALLQQLATGFLCFLAAPAVAQEPEISSIESTPAPAQPDSPGERYEGYLFRDADGDPLPFQSDAQIEDFLVSAHIESMSRIPVGISDPRKLLLSNNGVRVNAVFKDIDVQKNNVREKVAGKTRVYFNWRDWYGYDLAAYHVDRLLGLDRVPPAIERKVKGQSGSVQIWIEGVISRAKMQGDDLRPPETARWNQQKSTLYIFDTLVANRDSNLGNGLIDGNWRLWFIDCSRCFGINKDLLYADLITHCDRDLWEALLRLDSTAAHERLGPFLSRGEIDALVARREKLVAHLQERIDELGEVLVLFDQRPPTDKAPWGEK